MNRIVVLIFVSLLSLSALAINPYLKLRLKSFRDPFKRSILKAKDDDKNKKKRFYYSNKASVNTIDIDTLRIVGVFLGAQRRAIAVDKGNKEPFIIKEGMKLGVDKIEVKAILPGGIVLVEKIINIYDEIEYLETIIPVAE